MSPGIKDAFELNTIEMTEKEQRVTTPGKNSI